MCYILLHKNQALEACCLGYLLIEAGLTIMSCLGIAEVDSHCLPRGFYFGVFLLNGGLSYPSYLQRKSLTTWGLLLGNLSNYSRVQNVWKLLHQVKGLSLWM